MNNTTSIWIELDGVEFCIEFEYSYYYHPAKLSGPWEDSYPEEEEFEFEITGKTIWLNAIESWELFHYNEDMFYEAAMEDIKGIEPDYNPMWDNERDYLIDEGC